ncbi:MAG TPA: glycosyltransferase family 4 protein [Gammaproteobacteria bacterium]
MTTPIGTAKPMCVAQLLPAMDEGGVERGTLEVARALRQAGHRALVISAGGGMLGALADAGAEHLAMPVGRKSPLSLALVPRLRRLLVAQRVDILHLRSRFPAWLGYLAWRGMPTASRPRLVTTVHGLYSVNWYSAIMTRGERVIAVSNAAERYLKAHYPGLDQRRIRVIHRGVDELLYHPGYRPPRPWLETWRASPPGQGSGPLLTIAGRLSRLKGYDDFITLIAQLQRRGLPVRGLVVGDDGGRRRRYAATLKQRVARENLPVYFIGRRTDLREIFAVSNVVVSLSAQPESFGRTVLEALALGTPVVGYDHGGVGEILDAMFPRGAVTVGDLAAAARTVEEIQARNIRVESSNPFTLAKMLTDTLSLYEELIND